MSKPKTPLAERLWSSVALAGPDDCWEWQKGKHANGYGRVVNDEGRLVRAHRAAYELVVDPIPDGAVVMHSCDNRACCNPNHLSIGTQADNLRDMRRKGRGASGERHGHSRFTDRQVEDMRRRQRIGEPLGRIAQEYNTNYRYVWAITLGGRRP